MYDITGCIKRETYWPPSLITNIMTALKLIRMFHQATLDWTWPVVLLGLLTGIASQAPIATKARGSLEGRWETLFSRSLYPISGRKLDLGWDRDYFTGIKRVRRLYCNVGIGFHLQITAGGQINGTHTENQYSLLMISTVELGVVSLYGVKTRAFIAMNSKGRLYASVDFNNECEFREILLPNRYNVYESKTYRGMYIALSKHGRAKRGSKVSPILRVTHFLPRL
ncbi:fibroblast growth factor 4A-like [Stegostoma tigrinum]|uniref:fibroblast growth factor 4A-like n=1 Tax=Stegostoma tigrinum TaxID=3053191 RepID=UPI00287004AC|nr:fibroblast growth factor 4A-like [Stegostoma tigrinum]